MPDELLTIRQAAEQVNLPVRWLKAEAEAGRIPHLRIGRRLMFNLQAVRKALLDRAEQTTPREIPR